jgi:hypothetical protein
VGEKLEYNRRTENLIEIVRIYEELAIRHPKLTDIDSITWNQHFVDLANQFEEEHPDMDWRSEDYPEMIESYAKEKILEFGGMVE